MTIKEWFDNGCDFKTGVDLYRQLPAATPVMLRNFARETPSNKLTLKYELKKALMAGSSVSISPVVPVLEKQVSPEPAPPVPDRNPVQIKEKAVRLADESSKSEFQKETLSMYPPELHPVYRERINKFYLACELKIKLNTLPENALDDALNLILQLEDLWGKIDKAWEILNHWKEHHRLMPVESEVDYSKMTAMQLVREKSLLESRISKRKKTLEGVYRRCLEHPEDKTLLNNYNRKKEELEKLILNLEKIKELIRSG